MQIINTYNAISVFIKALSNKKRQVSVFQPSLTINNKLLESAFNYLGN